MFLLFFSDSNIAFCLQQQQQIVKGNFFYLLSIFADLTDTVLFNSNSYWTGKFVIFSQKQIKLQN